MLKKTTILAFVALGLSGCFTGQEVTSIERRPQAQVEFTQFTHVVSASDQTQVIAGTDGFLRAFRARYGDVVFVSGGATGQRSDLAAYLRRSHPALRIVLRDAADPQPLTLVLERAVAFTAECDYFARSVTDGADQAPLPGFGCASDMSLAQMIADPRDLVTGKAGGAVDAELPTDIIQAVREERFSITVEETTTTGTSEN
ncbi:CpaD family pilus assembly lipoprotein [Hwanghaeella sp.]|uniref:CpaD family pilus assembly lipoprotein n=1 Tax=Hwanghaeella sp. TaxID=2605943 RepID=UPI003CCBE705